MIDKLGLDVSTALSTVLCGGSTNIMRAVSEQQLLDLEPAFMELVKTEATLKRIDHMVEHGKPFRKPIARADQHATTRERGEKIAGRDCG